MTDRADLASLAEPGPWTDEQAHACVLSVLRTACPRVAGLRVQPSVFSWLCSGACGVAVCGNCVRHNLCHAGPRVCVGRVLCRLATKVSGLLMAKATVLLVGRTLLDLCACLHTVVLCCARICNAMPACAACFVPRACSSAARHDSLPRLLCSSPIMGSQTGAEVWGLVKVGGVSGAGLDGHLCFAARLSACHRGLHPCGRRNHAPGLGWVRLQGDRPQLVSASPPMLGVLTHPCCWL